MIQVASFFALFIANSIVLFAASTFFPQSVVLGTHTINGPWVYFHSMGTLALVGLLTIPFFLWYEKSSKKKLGFKEWTVGYLIINSLTIWLMARVPDQFGIGISSWVVAIALGAGTDFVQGFAMMRVEKYRKALEKLTN